jgi:UDP-glucose 4-epimerase
MSKILVTGGSGFLGSFVADTLADQGHHVTLFDRELSPFLRPGQDMALGDILDPQAIARAMEGVDAVFHLAALADLNAARHRPLDTASINIIGTVNLLEAARAAGVNRFLFASTVYVYSRAGGFYRCSKQAAESYIEEYQQHFGLPFTILRYGSLYGPRADKSNGVYRLLRQALHGDTIRHHGTPEDTREYVHVEDAARLSVQALEPEFANQHLLITGNHPMRQRDLFTMFGEILGRELAVDYGEEADGTPSGHYRITPYAFQPKAGRKLTSNHYVDMGQGILQILEQLHRESQTKESAS